MDDIPRNRSTEERTEDLTQESYYDEYAEEFEENLGDTQRPADRDVARGGMSPLAIALTVVLLIVAAYLIYVLLF